MSGYISAMSNNRITADYEFFVNWQLSLQLVRTVGDLVTGLTIHRARVKHIDSYSNFKELSPAIEFSNLVSN